MTLPGRPEMVVPSLLLTTTGQKPGERFIFPLFCGETGSGSHIVVAAKGGAPQHSNWCRNLVANPEVEVQVGTKRLRARARTGRRRAQSARSCGKRRWWPSYADYQRKTEREIPVVVLDPVQ